MSLQKKKKTTAVDIVIYMILALFCFTILLPFWDMLILSITDPKKSASLTIRLWPRQFDLDAYEFAFSNHKIPIAYMVTIYRTVCGTALTLLLVTIAAYPLSKRALPFRNVFTSYFLIPMLFSGGLIPTYVIIRSLGMIDNLLVYILPGAVGLFYILLMRNFFMAMEKEIEDAALIDGAGYLKILFAIMIPLSKPVIATIALWAMVGHWNAWFDSLIYIRSDEKLTLQAILQQLLTQASNTIPTETMNFNLVNPDKYVTGKSFQAALTIITIGPIVAAYPFFQKYFVKGIMIGSLKG